MKNDQKTTDKVARKKIHSSLSGIFANQDKIICLASRENTPFYFFDQKALEEKIDTLFDAFDNIPGYEPYFPVKINHHHLVLKTATKKGLGLEVASIREMKIAIELGCKKILYFCPGKTNDDLVHLLRYSDHESFAISEILDP
jgi:diaminopimelate decarboxylase